MKALILPADNLHSDGTMTRRNAVVDERPAGTVAIPLIDVHGAALGVDHRGHAVHRAKAVVEAVVAVRVNLDEPRRDDKARGVDRPHAS